MKKYLLSLLACHFLLSSTSQKNDYRQRATLGIHFFVDDFYKSDTGNHSVVKPGLAVSYTTGLTAHFDLVAMIGGSFPAFASQNNSTTSQQNNHLLLEGDAGIRYKFLPDQYWISPYVQSSLGLSRYSSSYRLYLPEGIGVQVKLFEEAYLIGNAQERIVIGSALTDHVFFSLGIAGTINKKKKTLKRNLVDAADNVPSKKIMPKDSDGDGIPDSVDACPLVKGFAKYKGCPIPDSDGDGINDDEDSCPHVTGVSKYHGCPVPDRDGDGVNDEVDECPDIYGTLSNHGCPEINKTTIDIINRIARNIFFETAKFKLLAKSCKSLDTAAMILNADKNLKLNIEGHTDNVGTPAYNQTLSDNRAKAVLEYLHQKGIDLVRLHANGFGLTRPVADNTTIAGRAFNRRVELNLHYQ
ncbi:MAG TPA: OmpA family protein [Puia sp.]|jgi:OOP family OmpA-OmpF porin|nr:OmpA family protein [Puia sp.]